MSKKPKYKRFATILKEQGYEGRPVPFLRQLLKKHKNVKEAAEDIGTTHATLYNQLAAHNLIVETKSMGIKSKEGE
jgi:hypothetical protein